MINKIWKIVLAPPSRLHTSCRLSLFTEAISAHLQCRALRGFVLSFKDSPSPPHRQRKCSGTLEHWNFFEKCSTLKKQTLKLCHYDTFWGSRDSRLPWLNMMLKTKGWTKCSPLKVSVQMMKIKPHTRFRYLLLLHTHSPVAYGIERTPWIMAPSQFRRLPHGFAGDTTFSCPFLKKMNKEDKLEERIVTPGQNTPSAAAL